MSHVFSEGYIRIWVGEVIRTIYVAVVDVEAPTLRASVVLFKKLVFAREQFWTACQCAFATDSTLIVGSTVVLPRLGSARLLAWLGILSYKYGSERLIEKLERLEPSLFGQKGKFLSP